MATFTNQALLTLSGNTVASNVASGELLDVLSLSKTAVGNSYNADGDITYIVTLTNTGTAAVSGITLTDNLGAYTSGNAVLYPLAYKANSIRYFVNGVLQAAPAVTAGPPMTVTGITVPAGGNVNIVYEADVTDFAPLTAGSTITNTASAAGAGALNTVTDSETVTVASQPNLRLVKEISPNPVTSGSTVTYTIRIENYGNTAVTAADDAIISDILNPVLTNLTATFNGTAWTVGTNYTYNTATGLFTTASNQISVPAATFTQDATTGIVTTTPGVSTLVLTGTI